MRKLILFSLFFLLTSKAYAIQIPWSECVSTEPQCGTDNGTQSREVKEYAEPICPMFYEVQNSGNWNQVCHRIFNWQKPEHKAPIGCPEGYEKDGAKCSRLTVQEQSCQTGVIQYDSCEEALECPTECGYEGGEVADGQGGYKVCEPTLACEIDVPEVKESGSSAKVENTFHKDKRCHDRVPPKVTWIKAEDGSISNNWQPKFTWSAEGGDKVEFRFSEDKEDLRWQFKTLNDGHETMGTMENSGILGQIYYYWQVRTVNGCKSGEWSDILTVFN